MQQQQIAQKSPFIAECVIAEIRTMVPVDQGWTYATFFIAVADTKMWNRQFGQPCWNSEYVRQVSFSPYHCHWYVLLNFIRVSSNVLLVSIVYNQTCAHAFDSPTMCSEFNADCMVPVCLVGSTVIHMSQRMKSQNAHWYIRENVHMNEGNAQSRDIDHFKCMHIVTWPSKCLFWARIFFFSFGQTAWIRTTNVENELIAYHTKSNKLGRFFFSWMHIHRAVSERVLYIVPMHENAKYSQCVFA